MASDEVLLELSKKQDGAYQWAKTELSIYGMDEPIQAAVAAILAVHPRLVDERKKPRDRAGAELFRQQGIKI
jgi:hypothetical protein